MPTPSETRPSREWAARSHAPRRSVFGNYASPDPAAAASPAASPPGGAPIQTDPAVPLARAFIYRYLAQAFEDPHPDTWAWLCDDRTQSSLRAACQAASASFPLPRFDPAGFDSFQNACLALFGHAARGSCPLNEIEYGDLKADPLYQPHRLADLAAFYRAFGLEVAEEAGERQDHLCLELEFMCVLAAREAYAYQHSLDAVRQGQARAAQRDFLREHLGRWCPAFSRRLLDNARDPVLRGLAEFIGAFVEAECHRFGVCPGSSDLLLRPVDTPAESQCASCGLAGVLPGAPSAE